MSNKSVIRYNGSGAMIVNTDPERHKEIIRKQKQGECTGTCIYENAKKLVELWDKYPECTMLFLKMDVRHYEKTMGLKYINHFVIYSPKNKKIIDVSNGWMKMIDREIYFDLNKVIKSKSLSRRITIKKWEREIEYNSRHIKLVDIVEAWCEYVIDGITKANCNAGKQEAGWVSYC